jgi:hypothetical protein
MALILLSGTLRAGSRTRIGTDLQRKSQSRTGSRKYSGSDPDVDNLPVAAKNHSSISWKSTFVSFIDRLSKNDMDSQLCWTTSANHKNNVSLTKVIQEMLYLPYSSSLTFTATSISDTFSVSSPLFHSAYTGHHEVCALILSYYLWVLLS